MMTSARALRLIFALAACAVLVGCDSGHQKTNPESRGALAKLKQETPKLVPRVIFAGVRGKTHSLREFRGHYILLNLWATWCAPCVRELPSLAKLQEALGKRRLKVIPVNVGRSTIADTQSFLKTNRADLPAYLDGRNAFLRTFGAFGLPLTVLIDPRGREIGRAVGAVKWDSREAIAYFKSLP